MITEHDLRRAAPQVIKRLRAMTSLPPSGTVAGQAVASLMYEELGLAITGPINDIDVFVDCRMPRELRGKDPNVRPLTTQRLQKTTRSGNLLNTGWDEYTHVKFIALRSSIKILSTYKVDLLNYTLVADVVPEGRSDHSENFSRSQAIIEGFDLNLVAVGINLDNDEVVFTPDFLEFCNTGQIKAQTCNTPAHTLVRLAKKHFGQEIIGATCDFDGQRQMLEMALLCQKSHIGSDTVVHSFGKKYSSWAQQYQQHLPVMAPFDLYGYPLSQFDVSARPLSEVETMLVEASKTDNYTIFYSGFVVDFPKLYETITNPSLDPQMMERKKSVLRALHYAAAPNGLSPELQQKLVPDASFDANDMGAFESSVNDLGLCSAVMLNQLQVGMGRPSIVYDIKGYAAEDSASLFYGQKCAANPRMVQQVIDVVESSSEAQRAFFLLFDMKADDLLEWSVDPNSFVVPQISKYFNRTLLRMSGICATHYDDPNVQVLSMQFFQGLTHALDQAPDDELRQWVSSNFLNIMHFDVVGRRPYSLPEAKLPQMIASLPAASRGAAFVQLCQWCCEHWPDTSSLPSEDRLGIAVMVALSHIEPHDPSIAHLVAPYQQSHQSSYDFAVNCMRLLVNLLSSRYGASYYEVKKFPLTPWLEIIPSDIMFDGHYVLPRLLISLGSLDALQPFLDALGPQQATAHMERIQEMLLVDEEKYQLETSDPFSPHSFLKEKKNPSAREEIVLPRDRKDDILQQLQHKILELSAASVSTPQSTRAKRM